MISLVYVHIGKELPSCLYDSLYQTLLVNKDSCKIYIIMNDSLIDDFNKNIATFNVALYFKQPFSFMTCITCIPLSSLRSDEQNEFMKYKSSIEGKLGEATLEFRDGFWISTTSRFYYIDMLMRMLKIENVFHIENDIMMYSPFESIYNTFIENGQNKIWMVKDAPRRVVPSILFFPNSECSHDLAKFITHVTVESTGFLNDMDILGMYTKSLYLPITPCDNEIFDGASIGQYLGGVDLRNVQGEVNIYDNKTIGFVNETSLFNPATCDFPMMKVMTDQHKYPLKKVMCKHGKQLKTVANLHIHSKQLYQFSSVFDIGYNDIISGDRVVSLCDFVITTREIYNFHKNIETFAKDIIIIKDWNSINKERLNSYFTEFCKFKNTRVIKLFIYTHILDPFMNFVLDSLDEDIKFVLYIHNSDHSFNSIHEKILNKANIKHVFAQNIDYKEHNKLSLLPIGIANSMWEHGDLMSLYTVMKDTYKSHKSKELYVNISPNTFGYRKSILDSKIWDVSSNLPYKEYLEELATHRFCLALRGNAFDTHRFYESLYLGVIPVIINNSHTNMNSFVDHLRTLQLPFYEIKENDLSIIKKTYSKEFFNETLYQNIMCNIGVSIHTNPALKLSSYVYR